MHTYSLQSACILVAIYSATSSVLPRQHMPKVDEFNNVDCTTTFPDSVTNSTPTYHHSPPQLECVGIDPTTKSVIVIKGPVYGDAYGYFDTGVCDNDKWPPVAFDITFNKSIDGGSSCHPVDRSGGRVHDIMFPQV